MEVSEIFKSASLDYDGSCWKWNEMEQVMELCQKWTSKWNQVDFIEITRGTHGSPGHSHPQNSATDIRPKAYWVTGS